MNHRKPCRALDQHPVRDLGDAEGHAKRLGYDLRTTINISPWLLTECPADLRAFFDEFMNKLRTGAAAGSAPMPLRSGRTSRAIGASIFTSCSRCHDTSWRPWMRRRWLPGVPEVVKFELAKFRADHY
jgi:hypothetical protein